MCILTVPPQGAAQGAAVRAVRALCLGLDCWCHCKLSLQVQLKALLFEWRALGSWPAGACRMPLWCCRCGCALKLLLVPLQGVRFGAGLLVLLQGVGAGYYCQRAVCIFATWVLLQGMLSECSVRYEAWAQVSLQGVAAGCLWQCGHWALMEITLMR